MLGRICQPPAKHRCPQLSCVAPNTQKTKTCSICVTSCAPPCNFHDMNASKSRRLLLEGANMLSQPSSRPRIPSKHLQWADPHRAVWPRCSVFGRCRHRNILAMEPVPGSPTIPAPSIFQSVEHPTATPEGTFDIEVFLLLCSTGKMGHLVTHNLPTKKATQQPKKGPCAMAKKRDQYSRRCRHTAI